MPKVGKNIYKRKDGRWEGRYIRDRMDGRTRYGSVYASSYRETKAKLEVAREREAEKLPAKAGPVSEISKCWLAEAANDLKESSVIKYEYSLDHYILPVFGSTDLSDITNEDLIRFANDLRKDGGVKKKGLAASSVSEIITIMNALRIYALRRGDPVMYDTKCVSLKHDRKAPRVFSISEENRLIAHLRQDLNLTGLGILVCLYTGIRLGELCALKWSDVNIEEKTMQIGRTMQRIRVKGKKHKTEVKLQEPKSAHSIRIIPLPDVLVEDLKGYYAEDAFLLTGKKEKYVEPRVMQKRFKRILNDCGIADANFHATRHSFATRCIEIGFDVKSLSEILGHSNVSITMNRYVHPSMELKAENMNRFAERFGE